MSYTRLEISMFALVELLGRTELTDSSRHLIAGYFKDAIGDTPAARVRATIDRYLGEAVPSLEEVREHSRTSGLSRLDHLVLKMEYEASRTT